MKLHDFLEEKEFAEIVHGALLKTLLLVLKKGMPFSVVTNIARVGFNPSLPQEITKRFQPATIFTLDGYTLSSAKVEEGMLSFEAGFGESNFGSIVSVPIGAILQIFMENTPLFLNMSIEKAPTPPPIQKTESKNENAKRSLEALLNNPENKKLIKK